MGPTDISDGARGLSPGFGITGDAANLPALGGIQEGFDGALAAELQIKRLLDAIVGKVLKAHKAAGG